jgi:predicted phage tail component-like protein
MSVFTFDGVTDDAMSLRVMPQTSESLGTPLSRVFEVIPGMDGAYLHGTTKGPLQFDLPCSLISTSDSDAQTKLEALRAWLITDSARALVFADRPDRTYLALLDGETSIGRSAASYRTFTLHFVVSNPVAWADGDTTSSITTDDEGGSPFDTSVVNAGGAPTCPRFTLPFTAPATFVKVSCGGSYVQVGAPATVADTPFEARTVVLHDDCSSLTGWGTGTNGTSVVGTMTTDSSKFYPSAFSSGTSDHGPTIRKVLASTVQDFEATAIVGLDNRTPKGSAAGVYVYLMNAAHTNVFVMRIMDASPATSRIEAMFAVGSRMFKTCGPHHDTDYNNFNGVLRITRVGAKITMTVGQGRTESGLALATTFTFTEASASAAIAEVELRVCRFGTNPATASAYVTQVDVVRLNTPSATDVVYVAGAGDTLTLDHATSTILRTAPGADHAERYMTYYDFESDFFALPVGTSTVSVATDGTIVGASETHRNCWR